MVHGRSSSRSRSSSSSSSSSRQSSHSNSSTSSSTKQTQQLLFPYHETKDDRNHRIMHQRALEQCKHDPQSEIYVSIIFCRNYLHTITPSNRHTVTPSHRHTVTPSHRHTVTPSHLSFTLSSKNVTSERGCSSRTSICPQLQTEVVDAVGAAVEALVVAVVETTTRTPELGGGVSVRPHHTPPFAPRALNCLPPKQLWPSCPTTKPTTAPTALIDHAAPTLAQVWGMRYGTCNMRYGVWGIYVLVISSPCDIYTYALYICISLLPSSSSTPNFYRWLQLRLPNRLLCWQRRVRHQRPRHWRRWFQLQLPTRPICWQRRVRHQRRQ